MTSRSRRLAAIHSACFSTPRPWSEAEFKALIRSESAELVQFDDGFVLGRHTLGEAEILTIAVMPERRRRGTGNKLLHKLEGKLARRGTKYLYLEVAETNQAALALYYSRNYRESGRRSGYYSDSNGTRSDALILSKSLG